MENLTVAEIIKLWGYGEYCPLGECICGWDLLNQHFLSSVQKLTIVGRHPTLQNQVLVAFRN